MSPELKAHLVLACTSQKVQDGHLKCFIPGVAAPKWEFPARGYGSKGPGWKWTGGDTPPGRYRLGTIYVIPPGDPDRQVFGEFCVDLVDLENQEGGYGRAGISIHAGRTLYTPTYGCVRMTPEGLLAVVETTLWARKTSGLRKGKALYSFDPRENYVDFTMQWVYSL